MKILLQSLLLLVFFTFLGCASNQRVSLLDSTKPLSTNDSVTITDLRGNKEKKIRYNLEQDCERWYGDEYMEPGKLKVLKQTIIDLSGGSKKISINLKKFDTVEVCLFAASRAAAIAQSAAVSANVSSQTGLPVFVATGSSINNQDYFKIHISGDINSKPFDVSLEFGYGDLNMDGSFDQNEEYVGRIRGLLNEVVIRMLSEDS